MRQKVQAAEHDRLSQMLRKGLAGGLAGCTAKTVVAPLERVKILFQTAQPGFKHHTTRRLGFLNAMQSIRRSSGNKALFQGHSLTLLRIFPYAAINYLAYDQIRSTLIPAPDHDTPIRRFISGSLAGAISTSCTYPFELIRVNMAVQSQHTSLARICKYIYHDGTARPDSYPTIRNFYRGYAPTLLGILPYAGMSFFAHDFIGDCFRSPILAPYMALSLALSDQISNTNPSMVPANKNVRLTAPAELISGALAGLTAQTFSYPLEIIRRRMQVGRLDVLRNGGLKIADTARRIHAEGGLRGFYVGLTIGYVKVVPMVATSFFVYDRLKWYLGVY